MIFETYFFSKNGPKNKVQHFCVFLPSKMLHFAFGYLNGDFFFSCRKIFFGTQRAFWGPHVAPPPFRESQLARLWGGGQKHTRWDLLGGGTERQPGSPLGSKKIFFGKKNFFASADFFFWGPPRGPPKFCQKPSFEKNAHLYKVLFHFHSKLRLGPKSGFSKIDFSTPIYDL